MIVHQNNKYIRRTFRGFDEYLSYAQSPLPAEVNDEYGNKSVRKEAKERFNGATYEEGMKQASQGWKKGWEIAKKVTDMFTIEFGDTALRKKTSPSYHGQRVNMSNYLTNNPRSMNLSRRRKLKRPGKIVKIFIHTGFLSKITKTKIANRGAAVLALVEALELSGYRVRIDGGHLGKCCSYGGQIDMRFPLKSEDQPIDKDRLGFCLVSPAMHRVVGFSAREHESLDFHTNYYGTFSGQGATQDYSDCKLAKLDTSDQIYIGTNGNDWSPFATKESSKNWLRNQFEIYGVKTND